MIRAEGLTLAAGGRWLLRGAAFAVEPGQTVVVTGANGSGKSLLARTAAGLSAPMAGRVTIGAIDVRKRKARRMLGYLPQNCGHYDYLTVAENLRFFAALAGVPWRHRRKVCQDLLELVGLAGVAGANAAALTPGQRQRLAIARTLAGDPAALVLDEPLQGLDAGGRAEFRQLLADLTGMGRAVLITAGDPDGLACDKLYVLSGGRLEGGVVA